MADRERAADFTWDRVLRGWGGRPRALDCFRFQLWAGGMGGEMEDEQWRSEQSVVRFGMRSGEREREREKEEGG